MKILSLINQKSVLKIVQRVCNNKNFDLTIIKSKKELITLIDYSLMNFMFKSLFSEQYDVILLDTKFLNILCDLRTDLKKNETLNYPTLLFVDDYSDLDLDQILQLKISSMISLPITDEKLITHFYLVANNYTIIKEIQQWAFIDPLTSLYNRRTLMQNLENYFKIYQEFKISFCLAIIDLDYFKRINDTFGHIKGDEVLEFFAKIMKNNVRKTDIVARMGGEEFAIIFPDTSLQKSYDVLKRIQNDIKYSTDIEEELKVTISAGLREIKHSYTTFDKIINDVDELLYKAKRNGRNIIIK